MKTSFALLALLVAAAAPPASAHAQQEARERPSGAVVVTVSDDSTGHPLAGARVRVLEHPALERTGADGVARLAAIPAGTRVVEVSGPGYATQTLQVEVQAGSTQEVPFYLLPQTETVRLEGVTATATSLRASLAGNGFYDRQRAWRGSFLTEDEIVARRPTRMRDLLSTLRGFQVVPIDGSDLLMTSRVIAGGGGSCSPAAYLDGRQIAVSFIMNLPPAQVEAIEAYPTPSSIPPQFSRGMPCGAVLVWTKR